MTRPTFYDAIVIGVGSMGAAACYQLSRQGQRVLGLEQYHIVHTHGSHTGQSRLIRKAYFEHQDYIPLLHAAYRGWQHLQEASNTQLYWETGLAYFGPADHTVIRDVQHAAQAYHLRLEKKTPADFPDFLVPSDWQCWLEPEAGYVSPERTIATLATLAQGQGADLRTQQCVLDWSVTSQGVKVRTEQDTFYARKLVITAGAYAGSLLPQGIALTTTRQYLGWADGNPIPRQSAPSWIIAEPDTEGIYYGFPSTEGLPGPPGMKLAHHLPGDVLQPILPDRWPQEQKNLQRILDQYFVKKQTVTEHKTCLYNYSQDEHFIIDHAPDTNDTVIIATGFSGHGFKFVPVIGEILADLVIKGKTDHPIDFLGLDRFS